jgi:hypothetical protein
MSESSKFIVPDEAVEAAEKIAWARYGSRPDAAYLRTILKAAAPHLLAEAWDEGALSGWNQSGEGWNAEYPDESTGECSVDLSNNPYR